VTFTYILATKIKNYEFDISSYKCHMFDRFAGRNATPLVYDSRPVWVGQGGMGCVVDERHSVAGELK